MYKVFFFHLEFILSLYIYIYILIIINNIFISGISGIMYLIKCKGMIFDLLVILVYRMNSHFAKLQVDIIRF